MPISLDAIRGGLQALGLTRGDTVLVHSDLRTLAPARELVKLHNCGADLIIDAFVRQNLPVVTVQPSACITTKGGRIHHFDVTAIQHSLRLGFIPVLYGDAVLDFDVGFTILSGDQLTAELAAIFNAEKTVIAVDVDGLFTDDPKVNPNAKLIHQISLEELNGLLDSIDEAKTVDVTKGMRGKITELLPAVERGIQIDLVNARMAGRLYKALKGEKVTGTKITRE